jgi:hypothetical protein
MPFPVYLRNYGPTNFLYFCDVAPIITLVGIWVESPLLILSCAVGIVRLRDIPVMPSASILRWFPDRA